MRRAAGNSSVRNRELRLSIVIPTYNGRQVLEACLASVERYRPPESEVIVVDDGSSDGTDRWVRAAHPDVQLLRLKESRGFCVAINAGIRMARGTIVETLNNDTIVTPGWTEAALALFEDPTVGSLSPLVLKWPETQLVDSAGDTYHICGYWINRGHLRPLSPELLHVAEVFGTSAAAGFYRREALVQVGGFSENFRAYYEDVDVAFRLRRAGYRCLYTPHSRVYHRLNYSHDHESAELIRQISLNEERVFWCNLPTPWLRRALIPHILFVAAKFLFKTLRGQGLAYAAGKLALLKELGRIRRRRTALRLSSPVAAPLGHQLPIDTTVGLVAPLLRRFLPSRLKLETLACLQEPNCADDRPATVSAQPGSVLPFPGSARAEDHGGAEACEELTGTRSRAA